MLHWGENNLLATGRLKSALLVSGDADEPTLKKSPCTGLTGEEEIKKLLKDFEYGVKNFREVRNEIYNGMHKYLYQNFDLAVVDLKKLNDETASVVPLIATAGVPCVFFGDPDLPFPKEIAVLRRLFGPEIPFFACCSSILTFLDILRRSEIRGSIEERSIEFEKALRALIWAEFDNYMERRRNGS